jgi:F0F1-type ATP synthase assembly protein I
MSDDPHLRDLRARQAAFEAKQRAAQPNLLADHTGASNPAMKAAMDLVGGVLAGVGLGWLADAGFAMLHIKTNPWGVVVGTLIGFGVGFYAAAATAYRLSQQNGAGQTISSNDKAPPIDIADDDDDRPVGGF